MSKKRRIDSDPDIENFSIKNFLLLCLGYWKWFLISAVFFTGVGLFYLYRKQPVYERSEEILVKDQDSGGGIAGISNAFSSLGLFSNNTKVYNELISFTSPAVMFDVVKRLNLTMNYDERDGLRKKTLYGSGLPINVEFPDLSEDDNVGFRLKLNTDGTFEAYKFYNYVEGKRTKYSDQVSGKVNGSTVMTPVGLIQVKTNLDYVPDGKEGEESKEIDVFRQSVQLAVEKYVAMLKGDLTDQDADVIKLSIKDTSKQRADDILNTVIEVYNERWIADNNKVSVATSKFISDRLALIEQELGQVDRQIASQKSEMKLPDLQEAAKGYMAQEFKMSDEQLRASNMLAMTTYLKDYLQAPANKYTIIPVNTGTENQVLEQQIGVYNELLLQRDNLMENSSADNPLVKDITKQLDGMRGAIIRSIDSHIANTKNILANIEKAQNSNKQQLGSSPEQARTLLSVERQQLVMQELYLFLLQKREENELTQSFTADNIRVVTPPYGKARPVSPNKPLIIIIAFIIGLGIPATAIFIADSSNTRIRNKSDIDTLPAPYVGEIPFIGKEKKLRKMFMSKKKKLKETNKPHIVVADGKRDIPNEAFRVIRSNLDFMLGKGVKSVVAFTSFNPGSGKSFIAYNLGASFALKGKKVLLIDCDLRHGSISAYVNSPRKGIVAYLNGETPDWQQMVVRVEDVPGLNVLPIGTRPPNPAELLDNGRLGTIIEEAKKDYDLVLVDCPPVNIVVDTQIINQYVDRTIFVVRAGLLEKKAVGELETMIEEKKLRNITLLLNGTRTEFSSYHTYGNYEAIDSLA